MTALPTRKMEAYRYADIEALASVWTSLATPERIEIAAQQKLQQIWLPNAEPVQVRRVEIALEAGATANIFALNTASTYGRIEIDVTLADGAHFGLDAANIGGESATLEIVTIVRHLGVAGTSHQTVRSVLGGKAVGSYLGKVAVARDAQQTDSIVFDPALPGEVAAEGCRRGFAACITPPPPAPLVPLPRWGRS
jgi:Fe-S cluster assembly protein SufD